MKSLPTILVVDDDPQIRELTGQLLDSHGFQSFMASGPAEADKVLERNPIDLMVLDLMMPDEDGRQYCQRLRQTSRLPIIMLTAVRDDIDRIVGLEMGADDYLTKPFTPLELVARIKAVLRRTQEPTTHLDRITSTQYMFDDFTLDADERQLRQGADRVVDLTSGEFALLMALLEVRPRVLSRDQLLDRTRGTAASAFDRSIDTHISRLRKKIESDPRRSKYIKTVRNLGYAFAGKVVTQPRGSS